MPASHRLILATVLALATTVGLSAPDLASARANPPRCISDYRLRQRLAPHSIGRAELARLNAIARTGPAADGWARLANHGDPYAVVAQEVVGPPRSARGALFHGVVESHWLRVVGPSTHRNLFEPVALAHFAQYVEILGSGHWPDSDQILNSYLAAARAHGLPDLVVFDSAWDRSGIGDIHPWQRALQLESARVVLPSRSCSSTSPHEALRAVLADLIELAF